MEQLLSILLEEFINQLPKTADSVKRDYSFPELPEMINVAIGIRRSGKTYLIYQKIRELIAAGVSLEQILYVNFEDDRLLPMSHKQLGQLLDTFYTMYPKNHDRICYIFLDEIQNIENWPVVIRRYHDTKNVRIFLTGSSAKLLSKEIATSLRGRSIATEVWPYSFHEYWKAHDILCPKAPIGNKIIDQFYQHFIHYLSIGGFPAVQHLYENERRTVLQSYVDTVVFRDIVERHNITNLSLVKYLIKTLIKNVAQPFSVNKVFKDLKSQGFKVGKDTVYQYIEYLEDAFLVSHVPIFTESIRKARTNPKKSYVVDNGLVKAHRLGVNLTMGSLFENQVYFDLRRQGKKVYYYLTTDGYEIDFVVEDLDGSLELLQATWDVSEVKTLERERRALEHAQKELGIPGRLVTPKEYLYSSFQID